MSFSFISLLDLAKGAESVAAPVNKGAAYQRADVNFYAKGDVLRADPSAVILPPTAVAQSGGTYTFTPKKKAPGQIYLEAPNEWIEPITPPDMPASLNIPPDAMQVREPRGDVQVALPEAPTAFAPVTDGMTLPNGAVIKTGAGATAAVLFGGVDSARLMPNSEAAVQQTVTPTSRSVEVDLTAGGVFSKVGTQVGVKGDFKLHTASVDAMAQGGDFATLTLAGRTDVWISQGKVGLLPPSGKKMETVTADGTGPLKLLRYPALPSGTAAGDALATDADTLTQILNFIPMANQKLAALHDKESKGSVLTANEQAYLHRIKQVPALIKLVLVEPPAPPAPPPAPASPPAIAAVPAPPEPVTIYIRPGGDIRFHGAAVTLTDLQEKLKTLLASKPDQSVIIKANPKAPYDKFQAVLDACKAIPVKEVAVALPSPQPPPLPANNAAASAAPTAPTNADVSIVPSHPPENLKPLTVLVHEDGQVGFQGKRTDVAGFKVKVTAMVSATPKRKLVIKAGHKVAYDKIKAVLDVCADAQVAHVTAPQPPAAPLPVTAETPPAPASPPSPVPPETAAAVNDKAVPAEIDLANDGKLTLDGVSITEDELKPRLEEIARTHPKNPLVMYKQPRVTRAQWQHYVALCHESGVRLLVKNAKPAGISRPLSPATAEMTAAPSSPAEGAASTPAPSPAITPHLSASPAPQPSGPAEIELLPGGQMSFLGETVSETELKSRLTTVARSTEKVPVLVVKDEKVTRDEWQHVVDICHAAGLKVRVKTVKSAASTAAPAAPQTETASATAEPAAEIPALHLSASPAPEKMLPVEIDLDADGRLTLDGTRVSGDDLTARLANIAQANPRQPIVLVKRGAVPRDMAASVITIIHASNLKVTVKTAKSFLPEPPPPVADAASTGPAVEDTREAAPDFGATTPNPKPPSP